MKKKSVNRSNIDLHISILTPDISTVACIQLYFFIVSKLHGRFECHWLVNLGNLSNDKEIQSEVRKLTLNVSSTPLSLQFICLWDNTGHLKSPHFLNETKLCRLLCSYLASVMVSDSGARPKAT